ncbi:MAG: hypothetical protein V1897_15920, partial [Pseudomonadota bacterium]
MTQGKAQWGSATHFVEKLDRELRGLFQGDTAEITLPSGSIKIHYDLETYHADIQDGEGKSLGCSKGIDVPSLVTQMILDGYIAPSQDKDNSEHIKDLKMEMEFIEDDVTGKSIKETNMKKSIKINSLQLKHALNNYYLQCDDSVSTTELQNNAAQIYGNKHDLGCIVGIYNNNDTTHTYIYGNYGISVDGESKHKYIGKIFTKEGAVLDGDVEIQDESDNLAFVRSCGIFNVSNLNKSVSLDVPAPKKDVPASPDFLKETNIRDVLEPYKLDTLGAQYNQFNRKQDEILKW